MAGSLAPDNKPAQMRATSFFMNEFQMDTITGGSGGHAAQAARTGPLADPGERQASAY